MQAVSYLCLCLVCWLGVTKVLSVSTRWERVALPERQAKFYRCCWRGGHNCYSAGTYIELILCVGITNSHEAGFALVVLLLLGVIWARWYLRCFRVAEGCTQKAVRCLCPVHVLRQVLSELKQLPLPLSVQWGIRAAGQCCYFPWI